MAKHVNIFYGSKSMARSSFHEYFEPTRVGSINVVLNLFHASRESTTSRPLFSNLAKLSFPVGYRIELDLFSPKSFGCSFHGKKLIELIRSLQL